jgi:hypothetical protein
VLFDAWRYERAEHIVVPLLHQVYKEVARWGPPEVADKLRKALRAVVAGLNFRLLDVSKVVDQWEELGITELDAAFSRPFAELRSLPESLGERRIVILIDDLDRCSDRNVVEMLEAINLVMDVPGLIFVLALDYDVLVRAIERRYEHVNGHAFIEKLVQLPFRVPPLVLRGRGSLEEILPKWESYVGQQPDHFYDGIADISRDALRGNPRQVKRLLNSFLLIRRIMERRSLGAEPIVLAALIAMQLRWPEHHQRLLETMNADLGPDTNLGEAIHDGLPPDPVLEAHLTKFVYRSLEDDPDSILRMLRMTAVVASDGELEPDPFAQETL